MKFTVLLAAIERCPSTRDEEKINGANCAETKNGIPCECPTGKSLNKITDRSALKSKADL